MPAKNSSNSSLTEAQQAFRKQILDNYDLEEDVVNALVDYFTEAATKHLLTAAPAAKAAKSAAGTSGPKAAKPKRKKSAYNIYVREMMKTDDIQALDHKEKMSAIAKQWKELNADEKAPYNDMAHKENDAAGGEEAADEE